MPVEQKNHSCCPITRGWNLEVSHTNQNTTQTCRRQRSCSRHRNACMILSIKYMFMNALIFDVDWACGPNCEFFCSSAPFTPDALLYYAVSKHVSKQSKQFPCRRPRQCRGWRWRGVVFQRMRLFMRMVVSLSPSPVRVRDYSPAKDTGWQNSTNQSGFGRTAHKSLSDELRRSLACNMPPIIIIVEELWRKILSKCHPNVLMDGRASCKVYKQNSTPNSSRNSRKRI